MKYPMSSCQMHFQRQYLKNSIEDKALTTNTMYCLRFQLNDGMVPTQYRVGIIGNTSFGTMGETKGCFQMSYFHNGRWILDSAQRIFHRI